MTWHTNDGDGLNAAEAVALADALDADLASGAVDAYAATYSAAVAALPREKCDLCELDARAIIRAALLA